MDFYNRAPTLTFMTSSIAKNANKIVFVEQKIHAIHALMVTLFTRLSVFNVLKPQEFTGSAQDAVRGKLEQFWPVQIALLFQENIPFFFPEDAS